MPWTTPRRPTCTIADAGQDRAKSRESNARLELRSSCALAADLGRVRVPRTTPTGRSADPHGQVRPPDGPTALWRHRARVPIVAEWGFQWQPVTKEHPGQNPRGGPTQQNAG